MRIHPVVGLMVILFGAASVQAADAEWRVGLAQIKITPEKPIFMAGYASRTKPFDKVAADLFVKAIMLEDRDGQRALLVTSDVISGQRPQRPTVIRRLIGYYRAAARADHTARLLVQ